MSDQYYASLNLQASAAFSCDQLQRVANRIGGSLNAEILAINATLSNVTGIYNTLLDIQATITALLAGTTALETLPASAAGLVTLGQVIAFCQLQATIVATFGTSLNANIVKDVIRLVNDITILENQITALNDNLTAATTGIARFGETVADAARKFPSCEVTLP